ncbi:MAG: EF-P lysine aminoacylase EpmA [Myxococcales bacterium]|nr:EF-P lysine aminoacylase EpmA [Myxococcales bacterium]MDH3842973.1 EF-P lysine aminoacylase EpmA [Myxococcales bacterium]
MAAPADLSPLDVLKLRARLLRSMRRFFEDRGFIEVEVPTIVPSPGLDFHLSAFEVNDPHGAHVGWLATSPEYQMKRLLSSGAERIFQLAKSYRADEKSVLHEREFTMLEWYRAHATSETVMRDTEELVEHLATSLAKGESPLLRTAKAPWPRCTVEHVVREHAGVELDTLTGNDEEFFRIWVDQVQPRLGSDGPVFVTDWPASMASLARLKPNGMADRFEAFLRGVELCNGFGELTDADEQRRRLLRDQAERRAAGKPVYPVDERFLQALEEGMPESGGNALGVDRLLMLLVGADSIQAVMPFPEDRL